VTSTRFSSILTLGLTLAIALPSFGATLDAASILDEVALRYDRFRNHSAVYEVWDATSEDASKTYRYRIKKTAFEEELRFESDLWRRPDQIDSQYFKSISAATVSKQYNSFGGSTSFLGNVNDEGVKRRKRMSDACYGGFLFGFAKTDREPVWTLMSKWVNKVRVEEGRHEDSGTIVLTASLPCGNYSLTVEPEFDYRIRGFSYEKLHTAGHFPPLDQDEKESLVDERDHVNDVYRGNYIVSSFQNSGDVWIPKSGKCDHEFQYSQKNNKMDEPRYTIWWFAVEGIEALEKPPPESTFEMKWPPYTFVSDRRPPNQENDSPPRYYADSRGTLMPFPDLVKGDPLPSIPDRGWLDIANSIDLTELDGKKLYIMDWGIFCAGCIDNLVEIQKLSDQLGPESNVVFLGINSYDEPAEIELTLALRGISMPHLQGEAAKIAKCRLGAIGAGDMYLFGSDGRLVTREFPSSDVLKTLLGLKLKE
jgi:hypothetical protein